jgi:hypothetical protein
LVCKRSRSGRVGAQGHLALNAVIVHIALPAVALRSLHTTVFDPSQVWPVLMPWLLFGLGVVVFAVLGRRLALLAVELQLCLDALRE